MGGVSAARMADVVINNDHLSIIVLCIVQSLLAALWLMLSFVFGFVLYDGAPGHPHAVNHTGFWLLIEVLVIVIGIVAGYFTLKADKSEMRLELHVQRTRNWLLFYLVMLVVAIIANAVHAALTIVESTHCSSSFCRGFNVVDPANAALLAAPASISGFMVAFIVLLFVDVCLVQVVLLYRTYVYRRDLMALLAQDATAFDVELAAGQESTSVRSRIVTPMMARMTRGQQAQRFK